MAGIIGISGDLANSLWAFWSSSVMAACLIACSDHSLTQIAFWLVRDLLAECRHFAAQTHQFLLFAPEPFQISDRFQSILFRVVRVFGGSICFFSEFDSSEFVGSVSFRCPGILAHRANFSERDCRRSTSRSRAASRMAAVCFLKWIQCRAAAAGPPDTAALLSALAALGLFVVSLRRPDAGERAGQMAFQEIGPACGITP